MKNYLIINEFCQMESFEKVYNKLKTAFSKKGEKLEILTNVQARALLNRQSNGEPILFWDKDVNLAKLLEKCGYRLINSAFTIETCDDKAKTYIALKGKVAQPKTILAPFVYDNYQYTNTDFLKGIGEELGYPLIVKENKGSFGAQVYLVNDIEELEKLVIGFCHSDFLFQEFISSSSGKDVRVYVVGDEVVADALRYNDRDFRSNVNSGGKMKKIENIDKRYLDTAILVAKELRADFAGVDLLISDNGPIVCEVNSNAHFNALSEVCEVDIAEKIVKYYLSLK